MKNFCTTLLFSVLLSSSLLAQPLLNNIPEKVGIVAEINLNSLKTNLGSRISSLDKKINFPMLNGTNIPASELLDASVSGVNTSEKAYFFMDGENSIWLLPISNATLFKKTVMKNMQPLEEGAAMPKFKKEKGSEVVFVQNHGITIKDKIAIITEGPYVSIYGYGYNSGYDYKEELQEFMRKEGITNEDEFVSPEMKKKIKKLIEQAEKDQIIADKEEAERVKGTEQEEEARRLELEEGEEVVGSVEEIYSEDATAEEEEYVEPYYYNWDHPILSAFDEEWEKYNERRIDKKYEEKKVEMIAKSQEYLNMKAPNSIANKKEFKNKFSSTHDFGLYMDASFPFALQAGTRFYRNLGLKQESIMKILEGNINVVYMDIKEESIQITGDQFINERFSKYETIKTAAVNDNFLKYLPAQTFGIAALNINLNETYNMSFDMYSAILSTMEVEKDVDISGALDMVDMFINKDMILNTFSGDALLAITGTSQFIGTKRTYEYDTMTYKSTMKTVADTTTIPEMIAFFTIKNQANFNKFMEALDKLKVIKKVNGVYNFDMKYGYESKEEKELKSLWTMGLEGNMFYITNSKEAKTMSKLPLRNEETSLNSTMLSLLKSNGNCMYYDHKAGINQFPLAEIGDRNMAGMLQLSTKYFHTANMTTTKVNNGYYKINASFNFNKENKENALLQMLDWMQEIDERY